MALLHDFRARLWPPVPDEIRDELAVLRYDRLREQLPAVYLTIVVVVFTAMLAGDGSAPWWVRFGVPGAVLVASAYRFFWWLRQKGHVVTPDAARRQMNRTALLSALLCTACSAWCIASWRLAAPEQQSYYPMFMAMGSLTTAFAVASVRLVTFANLFAGITPIVVALTLYGNSLDRVAAAFVAMATLFLVRMVNDQHRQLIDLLLLKHQHREQAHTDPLTGLYNRRALITAAEDAFAEGDVGGVGLALIDLDGFKAVNDRHGHAAGDELLIQVAARMQRSAGETAMVARLGGDEFALLVTGTGVDSLAAQVDRLLAGLVPSFAVGSALVTLGASAGMARAPADGASLTELFAAADRTLYAAKASRDAKESARRRNRTTA